MSTNDIGLTHIQKLKICAVRDQNELNSELVKKYGQNCGNELFSELADANCPKSPYEVIGDDYDLAMLIAGAFDADFVRNVCDWIADHRDSFGDTILEVGCGCGFITTFLGTLFPDKHITSIDRNEGIISIAKKNAELFGLNNIEFVCSDVAGLSGKTYDTVLSVRTMHENCKQDAVDVDMRFYDLAKLFADVQKEYAITLGSLVNESGTLVTIERCGIDYKFYAWLSVLSGVGLNITPQSHGEIKCLEVGRESLFEAIVCEKNKLTPQDTDIVFRQIYRSNRDTDKTRYEGWDAKYIFESSIRRIIAEFETTIKNSERKSIVIVANIKRDGGHFFLYNLDKGYALLQVIPLEDLDMIVADLENQMEMARNSGTVATKRIV